MPWRLVGALASALCCSLAFEPCALGGLAFVALVPLLLAVREARVTAAFQLGFAFGLAQALLSMPWLFSIFGPMAFALCAIYAGYHAALVAGLRFVTRAFGPSALLWAGPPLWVAVEWLRSEPLPLKFAWFTTGSAVTCDAWLLQTAAWWGSYGLSLVVVATNAAIALGIARRASRRAAAGVLAAVALSHGAGAALLGEERGELAVALIEGEGLPLGGFVEKVEAALREAPATRLVVLPEYTTFARVTPGSDALVRLGAVAKRHGVTLVFGGTRPIGSSFANTLFVLGPDGELVHTQDKSVPVPFFQDGEPAAARVPAGRYGCATCYDMDFPFVARELVANGAELLVFPTMDARHWGELQHRQHAALAPLRAVETRRWLLRCASSGITLVCDPWGRVTRGTGTLLATVAPRRDLTVYLRLGYLLPHACTICSLLLLLATSPAGAEARSRSRPFPPVPAPVSVSGSRVPPSY
jgi:apolipoprotein N-acyltransferase